MGSLLNLVTPLHIQTKRDCLSRMIDNKVECMLEAKKYDYSYWDGDRRFGYGGYKYIPERWTSVAKGLIDKYNLTCTSKILDIGCGKGFLLFELENLLPGIEIIGIDISSYALDNRHPDLTANLQIHSAADKLPFGTNQFDLVISLGTLHNLKLNELEIALSEMERVGQAKYLMVESYRNETEMFNLECWALTMESLLEVEEWLWLFRKFSYTGDYEFIYF